MATCNVAQNEIGGKELLLKACEDINVETEDTSEDITATAHGLKVGDLVMFTEVGANTVINTNDFYFVKSVTANTFKISATRAGVAIEMDADEAVLAILGFKTVGGLRSKSFAFNTEGVDITTADSDEWKVMLDGAGLRSFSISGSGVYTNQPVFLSVFEKARANSLICLMFIEVKTDTIFEGCFKITSIEVSGDYNAESNYSISAESSGQITVATLS